MQNYLRNARPVFVPAAYKEFFRTICLKKLETGCGIMSGKNRKIVIEDETARGKEQTMADQQLENETMNMRMKEDPKYPMKETGKEQSAKEQEKRQGEQQKEQLKEALFHETFFDGKSAKSNLLELTNAMLDTDYQTPEQIQDLRLEDVLRTGQAKEIVFSIAESQIVVCNLQQVPGPAIPVLLFLYAAKAYQEFTFQKYGVGARFKKERMQLPNLHFFVFYSGEEEYPSEKTEKLSGSYESTPDTSEPLFPSMELEVTIINVNKSAGHAILQRCRAMREYSEKGYSS